MAKTLFRKGKSCQEKLEDVTTLADELKKQLDYLYALTSADLREYLDALSKVWLQNTELKKRLGGALKHLSEFLSKEHTTEMLSVALRGHPEALDEFVDLGDSKKIYACQPRGLVVHWIAGNVPVLGLYSVMQALLTKNVSLIKASSRAYEELIMLLENMLEVDTAKIQGKKLASCFAVVLIDREDRSTQKQLSLLADARVAWGGKSAIEAIQSLPKQVFAEDIIFGPKYSYALIDKKALVDAKKLALRAAFDVCTFDQYACSSPHTILVETGGNTTPEAFAALLAEQMEAVGKKMLPKGDDSDKKMDILTQRTKYAMTGKVFSSQDSEWTVIYSEEEGLAEACFSRVVYVRPIKDIASLAQLNNRKIQTIGCALSEKHEEKTRELTRHGADRCPPIGHMTLYDSPWDGFFALEKMVRWVTTWKS